MYHTPKLAFFFSLYLHTTSVGVFVLGVAVNREMKIIKVQSLYSLTFVGFFIKANPNKSCLECWLGGDTWTVSLRH